MRTIPTAKTEAVLARRMVRDPTMIADRVSDTGVPEMVMPGPLAWRVVPAMARPLETGVRIWPPTVMTMAGGDGMEIVLPSIKMAEGKRLIGVPDIVMPGPPGDSTVPATAKPVGLAVKT